jgi:hypothetical protein
MKKKKDAPTEMKSDENSLYNKENQKKNHLNNCIILD